MEEGGHSFSTYPPATMQIHTTTTLSMSPLPDHIIIPFRWGNIPLDDAVQFNHLEVVKLLQDYQDSYTLSDTQAEAAAEALSKENLESMV